jgi:hypothetical protein
METDQFPDGASHLRDNKTLDNASNIKSHKKNVVSELFPSLFCGCWNLLGLSVIYIIYSV